jgi:hypothetical protein
VAGVFVGGCVNRGEGSSFRAKAHAHNDKKGTNYGWICVRAAWRVGEYVLSDDVSFDGSITKPSATMYHELAHILTPNHGHDDAWVAKMKALGQVVHRRYSKAERMRRYGKRRP